MTTYQQFTDAFTAATERLRRRLFRKPATAESASIFRELRDALMRDGDIAHAAFVSTAIAKCEEALLQPFSEAAEYTQAGTLLLNQQLIDEAHGVAAGDEIVEEAVQCFLLAAKVHSTCCSGLEATVLEQLALGLQACSKFDSAAQYYRQAATLHSAQGCSGATLRCLEGSHIAHIQHGDYDVAATVLVQLIEVLDDVAECVTGEGGNAVAEEAIASEHLTSLFLVRLIQRQRELAEKAVAELQHRLQGHPEQAIVALLHGCVSLSDGHDVAALQKVLSELEPWLSIQQIHLQLTQTVYAAVTDTSFLQAPL